MGDINVNIIGKAESDFFGIAKIVNSILEYKKFKIRLNNENKESLYHIVRKDILTNQEKTKQLIDKILSKYQENSIILSMQTIKILEYMDDKLLNCIISVKFNSEDQSIVNNFHEIKENQLLITNGLIIESVDIDQTHDNTQDIDDPRNEGDYITSVSLDYCYQAQQPLLEIYKLFNDIN